jgi:hypothetical protein|tara:strand:+ start:1072 stop:1248 length:177 start_codon:yes stop_codon:yes gene_type:complete
MDRYKKAKVIKMYTTTEGTLYKDSIVRVENVREHSTKVRDDVGKIYYVNNIDLVYIKF